jgi:O-antigen/teichoic acid export membrane protein
MEQGSAGENDSPNPESRKTTGHTHLGRHTATYIVGSGIALLSGIIMLPVYTRALTPKDYGLLETALRFVGICMSIAFLGVRQGYLRFYFDSSSENWHKKLTSTTVIGVSLVSFTIMLPLVVAATWYAQRIGYGQFSLLNSLLLALWLAMEATYLLGLSYLQVRFKSTQFILMQASRLVLLLGLNFTFLHVFHMGLSGALAGNLIMSLVSGCVVGIGLLGWSGFHVSVPTLGSLVKFGLPYLPTAVLAYIVSNADRLSLIHFDFVATLGLLSLASKLGDMALSILATPVENIWMPYAFSVLNEPDGHRKIGLLFTRYVAFSLLIALVISLIAPLAIRLLASDQFQEASNLVPIIAIGCVFVNASCLADLGILVRKRTILKPLIFTAIAAIAVGLQFLLTPRFGLVGAVIATTVTSICQFVLISTVAGRLYKFTVGGGHMLSIILAAGLAFLSARWFTQQYPTILGYVLATVVAAAAYMSVVHCSGVATVATLWEQVKLILKFKVYPEEQRTP